jgi:hypothetical protein
MTTFCCNRCSATYPSLMGLLEHRKEHAITMPEADAYANLQQRQRLVATQEVEIAQEDILRFQTEITSLHERIRAREAELAAWRRELERLS